MKGLFGEHLKCAHWDLVVLFRVFAGPIRFSLVRDDHLYVTLGSQRTAIEQGHSRMHTFLVYEKTSGHIVQSICDNCLFLEEGLCVYVIRVLVQLVEASRDVTLQVWVHLRSCSSRSHRLWLSKVLLSEQELPVEVAQLDDVWIGKGYLPLWTSSKTNHGEVFQKFASDSSSSYHEYLCIPDLFDEFGSKALL